VDVPTPFSGMLFFLCKVPMYVSCHLLIYRCKL
jgi:hypothetical protein